MTTTDSRTPLLGWVVDVQRDFMDPDGRLYVHDLGNPADPGARLARATIVRTVHWMKKHCRVVVYTGDWHAYGDREIDIEHADARRGTYPPHCMGMSPDAGEREGAAIIPEIQPGHEAIVLGRDAKGGEARAVARDAVRSGRPVFLQKNEFSCFDGNPETELLLSALAAELGAAPHVVICGVATDVCVRFAVEGMLDRGYAVSVVRDATWGLGLLSDAETWERWAERGARITSLADLADAYA